MVETTGARFGINLISAVSGEGTMRYMTISGRFNADQFIRFLKQLVRTHDRPIIVVADGHSAHKAKKVLKYLQQEPRLLGIHILSAYSPELNPDEYVWSCLRSGHLGRLVLRSKEAFLRAVKKGLRSLQQQPDKILGFFRAENTAYACIQIFG